jgi:hypothetical protein
LQTSPVAFIIKPKNERKKCMEVFHGTFLEAAESIRDDGILLRKCKANTDFGRGFYVSPYYEYAARTAWKKYLVSKKYGKPLVPVVVSFEYDAVKGAYFEHAFGDTEDTEWLQFIINNRCGVPYAISVGSRFHNLDLEYEIVSGRIADQNITLLANELKLSPRRITEKDVSEVRYTHDASAVQISFHTPEALQCLTYNGYTVIEGGISHDPRRNQNKI